MITGNFALKLEKGFNPPYMGSSNMSAKLSAFVKKNYPDSKSDLFACFIERCGEMSRADGYVAMITQHAWMFLSSFENLRKKLLKKDIVNMSHLGARAFEEIGGEVVQTTSMVFANVHIGGYKGIFVRLIEPTTQDGKEEMFLSGENRFSTCQENLAKIPGAPVAYWWSDSFFEMFSHGKIDEISISDGQTKTGNNDKYLRLLWEVPLTKIGKSKKWVIHLKGGSYRRWYGNIDTVIDWSEDARMHYRRDRVARIAPEYIWFRKGLSWTLISSGNKFGVRFLPENTTFNLAAPSIFFDDDKTLYYVLGFLNTIISETILHALNPTINTNISDITSQPIIIDNTWKTKIVEIVRQNIAISKQDWDSFEPSWDFERHPLV